MPSAPTTSIDLSATEVVADTYPFFARERSRHDVPWHGRGTFVLRGFRRVVVGNTESPKGVREV